MVLSCSNMIVCHVCVYVLFMHVCVSVYNAICMLGTHTRASGDGGPLGTQSKEIENDVMEKSQLKAPIAIVHTHSGDSGKCIKFPLELPLQTYCACNQYHVTTSSNGKNIFSSFSQALVLSHFNCRPNGIFVLAALYRRHRVIVCVR